MNNQMFKWQSVATVFFAVIAIVLAATMLRGKAPTVLTTQNGRPVGITMIGHSERKIDPDTAYVSLSVVTRDKSSRKTVDDNARISQTVMNAIKKLAIEEKDIQTRNYSLQPWVKYTDNGPKYLGYEVYNTVRVTVRDIKKVSEVIDAGSNAGANSVQGVSFGVDNDEAERRKTLADAVENARMRAEAASKELGVRVGKPISIKEPGAESDYAYDSDNVSVESRISMKGAFTPISPGQLEISQDIEVTFAIVD